MQTEHLQRIRYRVVVAAWLISIALASLLVFIAIAIDIAEVDAVMQTRLQIAAVAVGFFGGGLFAGLRSTEAPILHGLAIGLLSLVIWFIVNIVTAVAFPSFGWQALTPQLTVALILIQMVAAILGARAGYRLVLRGRS